MRTRSRLVSEFLFVPAHRVGLAEPLAYRPGEQGAQRPAGSVGSDRTTLSIVGVPADLAQPGRNDLAGDAGQRVSVQRLPLAVKVSLTSLQRPRLHVFGAYLEVVIDDFSQGQLRRDQLGYLFEFRVFAVVEGDPKLPRFLAGGFQIRGGGVTDIDALLLAAKPVDRTPIAVSHRPADAAPGQ